MSAPHRTPRRRLPQRVYWVRRFLVLGVAALLVLGITRLLTLGGGGGGAAVTTAGGSTSETGGPTVSTPPSVPISISPPFATEPTVGPNGKVRLARPDGPCDPSDVLVTPRVTDAHVAAPVRIVLLVTTLQSPACTFQVSPQSVVVRLLDPQRSDPLWSTQQCTKVVPEQTVVARPTKPGRVAVMWNGRTSDETCSDLTDWVYPGTYTAQAIAVGSTRATGSEFVLGPGVRPTVTRTPTPTATATPTDEASAKPGTRKPGTRKPGAGRSPSATPTR
jgi:hypothetical protein